MRINGYTVDKNLPAFRKAFNLQDILKELEHRLAIWKWIDDMCGLSHLPEKTLEQLSGVKKAVRCWLDDCKIEDASVFRIHSTEYNPELCMQLDSWKEDVNEEMKAQYQILSFILLELMELAEYSANEGDRELLVAYLKEKEYFVPRGLWICLCDNKNPQLYYRNLLVTEIPGVKKSKYYGLITVAEHPDTGYIGISKEGQLVNCSAFGIPELKKQPVKVLINQMHYVILLEDGSLIHNLRFHKLPPEPVRDVNLEIDQLSWVAM